jgi:MSHA pilin protein MshC
MQQKQQGFTLIELITVVILLGIISFTAVSRFDVLDSTKVQSGRDDLIAACFFAQQTAMARANIRLVVTANSVSVTENNVPVSFGAQTYPRNFPSGVTASPAATFLYDKLGRTTGGTITLSRAGVSTTVTVEASGYAH